MSGNFCSHCGNSLSPQALACPQCGHPVASVGPTAAIDASGRPVYAEVKSKTTAGVLAILLGGLGVHKFYLGKVGFGVLYLVFCWTYVPAIIGFIEGIVYLTQTDEAFSRSNGVRVG